MLLTVEQTTQNPRTGHPVGSTGAALLSTIVLASCLSGTSTAIPYRPAVPAHVLQVPVGSWNALFTGTAFHATSPVARVSAPARVVLAVAVRSDQDEVLWLKERSGLTWDQIGKVLGVSRRAVHLWATGARMNETHAARLREFSAAVREVGATSPDATRAALLAVGQDGYSAVDRFRRRYVEQRSWGAPFTPEELVRAQLDSAAPEAADRPIA